MSLDSSLLYSWGDESFIRSVQKRHLKYFRKAPGPILDIGCGRGIMLELLGSAGLEAYGLDLLRESVESCRVKGLRALKGDALEHLGSLTDRSLGGVFCSHLIEHMDPEQALSLIDHCRRRLKPGARIILVTPNSSDLRIMDRFWLDLTHVRPYPEKLLVLMLERAGFRIIKVTTSPEPNRNFLIRVAKLFLRAWFMGFMFKGDLVVVAERAEG